MKTITIAKGNYGVGKTINIKSSLILQNDTLTIIIKKGTTRIIEKVYTASPVNNVTTINFSLTQQESEKLDVGYYQWGIEHSRTGILQDLPLENDFFADFIVKEGI